MSVNLIFKIAAVGILVSVHTLSGVKAQRKRRTGISHKPCRTAPGFILDPSLYFRSV